MNEQPEITYEDMRKYLVQNINTKARDVLDREKKVREENENVAYAKESIAHMAKRLEITEEEAGWKLQWIINSVDPENKEDQINRLINDVLVYVDAEYEKGKHNGRDIRSLFGALFEMIGTEAYARFNAAYALGQRRIKL